jgi:hypothetical protein
LTDVFHNDDRVSGDAANVLDQRLEHGRVGNVLRHGNREAQIDRAVLEGQMCAIDLGDSKLPGQVEALPRTDLVSASAMTPTAEAETCPTLPVASFRFRRKLPVGTRSSLRNVMPFDLLHSPVE